jgi:hypothetical protein
MFVIILSIIDLLVGINLITGLLSFMFGYLAFMILVKGIISFIGSLGAGYMFDWMGLLDTIVGVSMVLTTFGIKIPFLSYLGYVIILKAIYCIFRAFARF